MSAKSLTRLIVALLALVAANASAVTPESLGYQVLYRGVFSLGRDMPIADIRLASGSPAGHGAPSQTTLIASSAAYGQVESLYPIRYRFRSWTHPDSGQLIGIEAYEKTHREKHRMYLRDDSPAGMRRIEPTGIEKLVHLFDGEKSAVFDAGPLFDRLGLLSQLRRRTLTEGETFEVPVTNGRDRMRYRVQVEKATKLRLDGVELSSWKLRLDATEVDGRGEEAAAHRPVYLWLSRDAQRIPLRVDVRHAVGLFRVQLSALAQQTALLAVNP